MPSLSNVTRLLLASASFGAAAISSAADTGPERFSPSQLVDRRAPPANLAPGSAGALRSHAPLAPRDLPLRVAQAVPTRHPAAPRAATYPRDPRVQPASNYPRDRQLARAVPQAAPPAVPQVVGAEPQPRGAAGEQLFQSGHELLRTVIEAVESEASISARVRQETKLFEQDLIGGGTYLQVRTDVPRWRIELLLGDGRRQSLFRQLGDGEVVWTYERVGDQQRLSKIDLARIRASLSSETATASPRAGMPSWGIGGLPQMLRGLADAFDFQRPSVVSWKGQRTWRSEGAWRREVLARLLPEQKEKILAGQAADLTKLSPQLPDRVVLYVGAANLMPERIEYLRSPSVRFYEVWRSRQPRAICTIELFDVTLGRPIDPRQFVWQAGNLEATDATEKYLEHINELSQVIDEAKRAGGREWKR
jgi:hypothetical protein